MRAPNASIFHETVSLCFGRAIEALGEGIKKTIYYFLLKKKITRDTISEKFDEVEAALREIFGASARAIMVSTLMGLAEEYSLDLHLEYADSLQSRLEQLCSRVLIDMLLPKRIRKGHDIDAYEDKSGKYAPWTG